MGKVLSREELILHGQRWKGNGKKIVFVAGYFDLLHPGHIRLLEQARDYGDRVVVGVLSDRLVSTPVRGVAPVPAHDVKRPITPATERAEVLAALAAVDYAFAFDSDSFSDVLGRLHPDVAIEGAEPSSPMSPAWGAAKAAGLVDVIRIPVEPGHSTSRLIERITQLRA